MAAPGIRLFTKKIFEEYSREFGERKARTLLESISDSTLLAKTLLFWDKQSHVPTYKDLQKVVGAINWFVFSKKETTALGMILTLSLWDGRINRTKSLIPELSVIQIAFDTLNWLKVYLDEIEFWQQEFLAQISLQTEEKASLVERVAKGCKISNIQQMAYNIVEGNTFRTKKIRASNINLCLEIGAGINGNIFTELPDAILNSLMQNNYDEDGNSVDYEPENLELVVTDIFSMTDTEIKIEACTPDTLYRRNSRGQMVAVRAKQSTIECVVDKNGICLIGEKSNWMVMFGGNIDEWEFSNYSF